MKPKSSATEGILALRRLDLQRSTTDAEKAIEPSQNLPFDVNGLIHLGVLAEESRKTCVFCELPNISVSIQSDGKIDLRGSEGSLWALASGSCTRTWTTSSGHGPLFPIFSSG